MPGTLPASDYRTTIRVVSNPNTNENSVVEWTANNGEKLKDQSAKLLAESFDIAFRDAGDTSDKEKIPERTIRYREGGREKMERAQVLSTQCDRLLIRSLRGTLLSVPIQPIVAGASDTCGPTPPSTQLHASGQ